MKKMTTLMALAFTGALSTPLWAADAVPHEAGIESEGYVWNKMEGEKLEALKARGDALRGEIAFEICQGCHRKGALGRDDGTYPRLAGQHASVLIKQMTDVRAGRRDNPKMLPFAGHDALSVQDIADISVYLRSLPSPADNGKGDGKALTKGKQLYDKDCATCHADNGEGDGPKFYPRVSGQHYKYLLREAVAIRDGARRNANPMMVKAIKKYSDQDLEALSDYISRFASK
ncbi:MAG: c-type cytochrome [Azonexus sp.]|nr:c-type cytochrome [Azonexus sp.]